MLADLSIKVFADKVASSEPVVPAGGCVMAVSGLLGVSLLEMAVDSAHGRPEGELYAELLSKIKTQLAMLHKELTAYIDHDAEAYGAVLAAYKLPKATATEAAERQDAIQTAALSSIEVPLKICAACLAALEPGILLLPKVKKGVLGDLKLGLLALKTGSEGALAAAGINLSLIKEEKLVEALQARVDELQESFDNIAIRMG